MPEPVERKSDWSRIRQAERGQLTFDAEMTFAALDDKGRLHSHDEPAIRWDDGLKGHFIEGVHFDPATWEAVVKGTLTPSEAVRLTNVEQRRIAIKRIGFNKMLESLAAKVIDYDAENDYTLYLINLYDDVELRQKYSWRGHKLKLERIYLPAKFVRVRDSTTGQPYFLRVPSDANYAKEAVAWTFAVSAEQYKPLMQT